MKHSRPEIAILEWLGGDEGIALFIKWAKERD
jgi:hypothetical protein